MYLSPSAIYTVSPRGPGGGAARRRGWAGWGPLVLGPGGSGGDAWMGDACKLAWRRGRRLQGALYTYIYIYIYARSVLQHDVCSVIGRRIHCYSRVLQANIVGHSDESLRKAANVLRKVEGCRQIVSNLFDTVVRMKATS